jgi:hypothetical protein
VSDGAASPPLVYVDVSTVRDGKLAELSEAMGGLARFVEQNMPRVLSYGFYLDAERTTMTVVAVHPDSASLEYHLDAGSGEFAKFADLIELRRIQVFGTVGDGVRERLERKVAMLGRGTVTAHELHAGFARPQLAAPPHAATRLGVRQGQPSGRPA